MHATTTASSPAPFMAEPLDDWAGAGARLGSRLDLDAAPVGLIIPDPSRPGCVLTKAADQHWHSEATGGRRWTADALADAYCDAEREGRTEPQRPNPARWVTHPSDPEFRRHAAALALYHAAARPRRPGPRLYLTQLDAVTAAGGVITVAVREVQPLPNRARRVTVLRLALPLADMLAARDAAQRAGR